jgi:predicted nucleic acid-binding protein
MTDALFDTTVFIDYYRGYEGAETVVESAVSGRTTASYSPFTVFELWIRPMGRLEEIRYLALLDLLEEAPVTRQVAQLAAVWLRRQPRMSRQRLIGDALIAATAAVRGEAVYTRNAKDFARFNIHVRTY